MAARQSVPDGRSASPSLVVRVYYDEISELTELRAFDVWEYNNLQEKYVLAAVDITGYQTLIDQGWTVAFDPAASQRLLPSNIRGNGFLDDYRTVAQLYTDLQILNDLNPTLSEVVDYGQSYCLSSGGCTTPGGDFSAGYPLRAIRITNEEVPGSSQLDGGTIVQGNKPVFFLMANIHSREITTPELAMRLVEHLLEGYAIDADVSWLVDHHEVWIVPTANPDGHWLVELGATKENGGLPFSQRKNANNDSDDDSVTDCQVWPPAAFEQFGIDLNRNHSFGWGTLGSSDYPCDMTFRGPSAASEIEVVALEALVKSLIPDQRLPHINAPAPLNTTGLFITLHSFSNLVLWPWGNIEVPAPNKVGLKAIGDKLATFNGYLSCQPSACLYLTSGSSDDWAYGELGVPAFTFEIGDQFMPPYSEIDNDQWPRNGPAFVYGAKLARAPYQLIHGPDVTDLQIVEKGPELTIEARINDQFNGNNKITAAVYSIDVPPWDSKAELMPLAAADGTWNSANEMAAGTIDLSGLSPGRHTLFVQGQDISGNWGVVTAEFFENSTTSIFEKGALSNFVAPGGLLHYEIDLHLSFPDGEHDYSLIITDPLPDELTALPSSILVNGIPSPEIFDATTQELRLAMHGHFTDSFSITIQYTVVADELLTTGQLITNQASITGSVDDIMLNVPSTQTHTLVLNTVAQSFTPIVLMP